MMAEPVPCVFAKWKQLEIFFHVDDTDSKIKIRRQNIKTLKPCRFVVESYCFGKPDTHSYCGTKKYHSVSNALGLCIVRYSLCNLKAEYDH